MQKKEIIKGFTKTSLPKVPLGDFVGDIELRWKRMNGLIDNILAQYHNPRILDIALGDGHDSIFLLKKGYNIISNEIEDALLNQVLINARKENTRLAIRRVRWEDIGSSPEYEPEEFDFVFSLGNSFPNYLLRKKDREKSLENLWGILKPGGTLLFDTRNFDYMFQNTEEILKDPEHSFQYKGSTTFLNKDTVRGFPIEITQNKVHFIWKHYKNKKYAELDLWPAIIKNVTRMINDVLGNIKLDIYFDYRRQKPSRYDFVQYVLKK